MPWHIESPRPPRGAARERSNAAGFADGTISIGGMKLIKPGPDHEVPRGIVGGAEISQATAGAHNIYMGRFRVPAGARSRPHYHEGCESSLYMLSGSVRVRWGDELEQQLEVTPGDML